MPMGTVTSCLIGSSSMRAVPTLSVLSLFAQSVPVATISPTVSTTPTITTRVPSRFPILGYFKGAVFLDAGNVWLLKKDENRPGAQLKMKNFFNQLALGTGVGLRFDMTMLVVRADLGMAIHAPYDTGRRGYFNIPPKIKDILTFHLAIGYPF